MSNKPRHDHYLGALSACLIGMTPLSLSAESSYPEPNNEAPEEMVIYAQKKEQAFKDVPLSLSVLSSEYVQQHNYSTLEQVSASQPAVTISKNSGASKIFVRGIGSQGNAGLEQSASTYIDEVYHGRSRSTKAALIDLEQLEILKGPQSTFFGVNSSAGAISVRTRQAELSKMGGYFQASVGDYGEQAATLAYNLPVSENFALRGVADISSSDGFWDMVDPLTGEVVSDQTGADSEVYRLSGLWQASSELRAQFKLEHQDIQRDNPYAWQPGGCGNLYGLGLSSQAQLDNFWQSTGSVEASPLSIPFSCETNFADGNFDSRSPASPDNHSEFSALDTQLRLIWDLGNMELTSITAHYDVEFMFEGNDLTHGATSSRFFAVEDNNQQSSQELRLTSKTNQPLQWILGAYWHSGDINYETGDADSRNNRNPQFVHTIATQEETNRSIFASLDWQTNDQWQLSAGLRWTQVEKTFAGIDERVRSNTIEQNQRSVFRQVLDQDRLGNPDSYVDFGTQIRNQFSDETRRFSELLPSFSALYRINEEINSYYRWSKGYKAGGFNFRLNGLDKTTLDFDAETVSAHEIGLKADLFAQRLRAGLAFFVSDYRGLQQNSNRGDDGVISAAVIRNAARASSEGLELELSWRAFKSLRVDWSATYLDAQFDDYQGADCTRFQSVVSRTDIAASFGAERNGNRCSQDLSGGRLAHAPELSSRLTLTHQMAIANSLSLESSIEWFYSDEYFTSPHADTLRQQPSFSKFNGRIGLSSSEKNWSLSLIANNLSNELTARQLGQDEDAAVSALLDDPRRISLQARYVF